MSSWIYFVGTGLLGAYLAGKSWLRWGNPDGRTLRRRWNRWAPRETLRWSDREEQFEQWKRLSAPDERLRGVQFFDGLDMIVGLLCLVVATRALGMFDGAPTYNGNGTVLVNNLLAIVIWAIKFVVMIVLVYVPVYVLLRRIQRIPVKGTIYFLVVILCGVVWTKAHGPALATQPAPAAETTPAQRAPEIREDREKLVERLQMLHAQARTRWRQDIEAANAMGPPGLVPPMLEVTQLVPFAWRVVNRSDKTVCLSIARVARAAKGATGYERCPSDTDTTCREIARGSSRNFTFDRNDSVRACVVAQLEFRVGTPEKPEPTFWSDSALQDFDGHVSTPETYADLDVLRLRGEIAVFEEMLSERDRASRWRRELGGAARQLEISTRR